MDRFRQLSCCRHGGIAGGFPGRHVPRAICPGQKETPMNNASIVPAGLPALDADSERHRQAVENYLLQQIHATGTGFVPLEQWMDLALYAPGLGSYAAGSVKFGGDLPIGDFATAPELTPLFGQVLANQVAQVLQDAGSTTVLEFGAGSGALAAAVIPALRRLGIEPEYQILEVSAELR